MTIKIKCNIRRKVFKERALRHLVVKNKFVSIEANKVICLDCGEIIALSPFTFSISHECFVD